jgi:glutaconyl-CoA/methylmalonyl-CoA decarboxylase subunit gamma
MKKLKISVNGKAYIVDVEILEDDENMGGISNYQPSYAAPVEQVQRPAAPKKPAPMTGSNEELEAPMNGVVVEILVKLGDSVVVGQLCVALEVMKMKTNVNSPINGVIKSIEAKIGEQVELGQALLTFE